MDFPQINAYQLEHSDVITFIIMTIRVFDEKKRLTVYKKEDGPLFVPSIWPGEITVNLKHICPILKRYHVGGYNWGLVSGKSNTNFSLGQ